MFGRHVEFGHDFNGIVCARRDLEVSNPDADPEAARLARQMFEADPASREPDMINRVRDLIVKLLGTGTCTIDRVAQHLGVDRRTIHRRLAHEGESFSGLVEAVRRELAERYISDPHRSLAEVSLLLGFFGANRVFPLVPAALQGEAVGATQQVRGQVNAPVEGVPHEARDGCITRAARGAQALG